MSIFEESMQIVADSLQGAREMISAWRITFSATPDSVLLQNLRRSMKVCLQEMMENLSRVDDDSSEADEQHECEANDANTPDQFEDIDDDEERSENVCVIGLHCFITSFYLLLTTQTVFCKKHTKLTTMSSHIFFLPLEYQARGTVHAHPASIINNELVHNTYYDMHKIY